MKTLFAALLMVASSTAFAHKVFPPDHPPEATPQVATPVEMTPVAEAREKIRCDLTVQENGVVQGDFAQPFKVFYEDANMTSLFTKIGDVSASYNFSLQHPDVTHVSIQFGDKEAISVNPSFNSYGVASISYAKGVGTPSIKMILVNCRKTGENVSSEVISEMGK